VRSRRRNRATPRRVRGIGVASLAFLALVLVSGADGAGAAATDLPLPAAVETPADSWVVLPMGQFGTPDNTFWQLLRAAPGTSQWSVVTPQGVADNGGLVTAAGVTTASTTVAFLPSQLLRFSPLSATSDGGRTWSPAFLPGALAARPNALASGPDGSLAIVGAAVLHRPSNSSIWSRLVSLAALQRLAPRCNATALDAVAVSSAGAPLVGTPCRGRLGLFTALDGTWHQERAALPVAWGNATTTILRLEAGSTQTTVLVMARRKGHQALFTLSQSGSGSWLASAPLPIGTDSSVRATAVGSGGALSVLVGSKEAESVDEITAGGSWVTLPAPAQGSVALAWVSPDATSLGGATLDAFSVVHGTILHVFAFAPGSGQWVEADSLEVPLPYGSSS
jgi:hypothetical protein